MGIVSIEKYKELSFVNPYILEMLGDFKDWTIDLTEAPRHRGQWRQALGLDLQHPLDLEIGVGNGYYFAHVTAANPDRAFLGIELKFKPLIQTVKRTLQAGAKDFRLLRLDANEPQRLFAEGELDNVYIFFPDPWPKKKAWKHRLIQDQFLTELFVIQKPGSFLEIKTDDRPYFDWILERAERSKYAIERKSLDLHSSEWASENFMTHFEKLWTQKGLPTHYLKLRKALTPPVA